MIVIQEHIGFTPGNGADLDITNKGDLPPNAASNVNPRANRRQLFYDIIGLLLGFR